MEETRKGLTINNRFTLQEYKGSGTFGEVWRASDSQKKKDVAIKIYISLNRQGCDEFLEEYKIASGLTHKNLLVTEQYDVWQSRPYLTMKYCAKGSVANLVGKLKPTMENERLLWAFIRDVSAGLTYLHNLEPDPIVHQDIKPDNVLMDSNGTFMITDFGISKKVRNTLRSQSKRAVEAGATAYMGPERFSKQPAPILASDIWSLGASIYELAEGELPFSGMGGIMLKNGAEMPDLNGWSDDLNNLMHRSLEKEPWKRIKAHEIEQLAKEKVTYYDDHLREYPGSTKYDPRATQRQTSSSSSSTNGTVKKEPTKPESLKPETPKPNNSLKGVWYFLAAIAACLVIYFGFFHESAELKVAKLHNEAYTTVQAITENTIVQESESEKLISKPTPVIHIPNNFVLVPSGMLRRYFDNYNTVYKDWAVDSFYICKYEVIQKDFEMVMAKNPSKYKEDSIPVHGITIFDAVLYCNNKSEAEGYDGFYDIDSSDRVKFKTNGNGYRLPTDHEWALAARNGEIKTTKYAAGNNLKEIAWYGGNSGNKPHKVGTKQPNGRGLYDMNGNVLELCMYDDGKVWGKGSSYNLYISFDEKTGMGYGGTLSSKKSQGEDMGLRLVFIPKR